MVGVVIIVAVLVLLGPVAVMVGGAAWSALIGWLVGDDAEVRAEGQPV
jgi:hypothetical protein